MLHIIGHHYYPQLVTLLLMGILCQCLNTMNSTFVLRSLEMGEMFWPELLAHTSSGNLGVMLRIHSKVCVHEKESWSRGPWRTKGCRVGHRRERSLCSARNGSSLAEGNLESLQLSTSVRLYQQSFLSSLLAFSHYLGLQPTQKPACTFLRNHTASFSFQFCFQYPLLPLQLVHSLPIHGNSKSYCAYYGRM